MRLDTTSTSSGTTTRGPSRKRKRADRNASASATEARERERGERTAEAPANGVEAAGSATLPNGAATTNGTAHMNGSAHGNGATRHAAPTNGTRRATETGQVPSRVRRRRRTNGRTRTLPEDGTRRRRNGTSALPVREVAAAPTEATEPGLTAEQLELLEQRLLDERSRALRAIWVKRGDIEDHRETGSLDEVEMDIRMAERHSEFVTLIDGALRRLRDTPEDFDVSEVSGARIPFERLEIVPWTRRLTEETDPFPG